MPNRLAHESSPYLLQHQDNPVDWYPWGEEALALARRADKAILLSIGYSACHWCHVMAHESFEDPQTAALMNAHFVNVKVDREERPDLDSIYMDAVTAMTGHGGWPMTVFLTPEGLPFYAGTYFPPQPRYGMPSFQQVLESVAAAYDSQRASLETQGERLRQHIAQRSELAARDDALSDAIPQRAFERLMRHFDARWGGFSNSGPKFPQPMILEFVLRYLRHSGDSRARRLVERTLDRMAYGGMYDQLGGGFARYSVDERWMVPHFEKMLYDNGQLALLYLHAFQLTGRPLYRRIAQETLDYLQREMLDPAGGFFSSQDADSEGEEGRFFVWTPDELARWLTPEEQRVVQSYFDVTPTGNFEGRSVLWVPREPADVAANLNLSERQMEATLATARAKLFKARAQRVAPGTDDKILTSWNALAIAAFAEASRILDHAGYRTVAERAAQFLLTTLRRPDGTLLRTWRAGSQAKLDGYLEDYAYLINALVSLYEATFEGTWLQEARALAEQMRADFADPKGGFFDTGAHHETLLLRPKDVVDNAMPSGNSMAALALLRLGSYLGEGRYIEEAERTLRLVGDGMGEQPQAFGHWLVALDWWLTPTVEVALLSEEEAALAPFLREIWGRFLPNKIVAQASAATLEREAAHIPLLQQRQPLRGQATAFLCENLACQRPTTEPTELADQLEQALA